MNRLCRAMAAAALALAAGCAKDAASLSPFPCAKDNTCPAGLACLPGAGCVKPAADAICAADGDCTGGAASLSCSVGRCLEACSAGAGCASGRTCTSAAAAGVCVADCGAGQACPVGLICQDAWGKKSCLPDGAGQGAACSAEGLSCGPKGAAAVCSSGKCEQACANGAGCPATRVCSTTKGAGVCLSDCTAGAACPAGTTCGPLLDVAKKGCLAANVAALDAACPTEGAPCGPLGAGGVCTAGRCEPACKAPADCAAGRFCTVASGDGVCLADCTSVPACPSDLVCNGPWAPSGKKLCVASGAGLGGGSTCFNGAAGAASGPKGLGALCDALICTQPCDIRFYNRALSTSEVSELFLIESESGPRVDLPV